MRFQISTVDQGSDLRQVMACHIDQEKCGFHSMTQRKILVRMRYRRNQLAASSEDLKRTLLRFAANQINDGVRSPTRLFKALGLKVDDCVCPEFAYGGDVIRCGGRDGVNARAMG